MNEEQKKINPFSQLVEWLDDGTLSLRMISIAYITHIRYRKDFPVEAKDFLCGEENKISILRRQFDLIGQYVGLAELMVRRAKEK